MRHRGNTLKRPRGTVSRSCHAVYSQTAPVWKSAYPTVVLELLFIPRRQTKQHSLVQVRIACDGQFCHLPSLAPASGSVLPNGPPVLSSLSQLAPITQNNPMKVLSVRRTKRLKIFHFFRRNADGISLTPAAFALAVGYPML